MGDLVLVSGGLDSTVCLTLARRNDGRPLALSFDYGQLHGIELQRSAAIATSLGVERLVVRLNARDWGGSALTDAGIGVPDAAPQAVPDAAPQVVAVDAADSSSIIPATYVPARNLIFLSIAAGIAEARGLDRIHIGVNAVDYSGYPDCRPEFIAAFREAARLGLRRGVEGMPLEIVTPLIALSKAEIVKLGVEIGAPLGLSWSCYRGGEVPCGRCDACALRAKGFAEAGVRDDALQASPAGGASG